MSDCVLITGGYGCIGAETAKWLLRNSTARVVVASRSVSESRTSRIFHDVTHSRLVIRELDVRDLASTQRLLVDDQVTHVVHLAALQTPDCNANRDLGLQINLAGTQNLIEAMKSCGPSIQRFVFASSVAVYGPRENYPAGRVPMLAAPDPVNVYGTWKLAGEYLAKLFAIDQRVSTVCLRPGVLYGPGRDAGLTSTPTTAMKAIVVGRDYQIPFCSKQDYLFAPDVGAAFGMALTAPFDGFGVFTLPSHTVDSYQFVQAIEDACRRIGLDGSGAVTVGQQQVPFICDLDYSPFLKAFPNCPHSDLIDGVQSSLKVFQDQVARGWIDASEITIQ